MTELLNLLQWPATAVTVAGAWLVASNRPLRRRRGFWLSLLSNAMWTAWAVPAGAPALVVLQLCLAVMNWRGISKLGPPAARSPHAEVVRRTHGDRR